MHKFFKILTVIAISLSLASCAGTTTAISKRNLVTENKMSSTIFLEPTSKENQKVYVQVRNTTDVAALDLTESIKTGLRMKGYQVVSDPKKAQYLLQANVLSAGEMNPKTREETLMSGFGGGLAGGAIGAGTGALISGHTDAIIGGALAGAALGMLVDASVKDTTYGVTTDIQISEKTSDGSLVTKSSEGQLKQGSQTTVTVNSEDKDAWKRYQTRVVSTANKVNLGWEQAGPALADGLSKTIVGIF
ncbi:MAG: complement resistance protein TraT [Gammaproteobacteria bacterium]